ncbi:MAG: CysB family HTH-type transcriptional regulator [Burkholderiales bacterium]|nr:CysB family HTH-type transcriptional regulator [Burkholderiales bacterium]
MNFQQMRYVRETVRQGLNLTAAAAALHTSQPGVSKQIRELEDELGVEIFVRFGKRITQLTEPGEAVVKVIERLLLETENLKQTAAEFADQKSGSLTIATTHTQARYALPRAVGEFKRRYPKVRLAIQQGAPPAIARMVVDGQADIAIATETIDHHDSLIALPCYRWHHVVVVPPGHALDGPEPLTLAALARHPIITYDSAFTGRSTINQAFARAGLTPNIVLSAIDSDVIKTYVELGLGVGILNAIAFDEERDRHLRRIDAGHLFAERTTYLALREGAYLRGFTYDFIALLAPALDRQQVDAALGRTP